MGKDRGGLYILLDPALSSSALHYTAKFVSYVNNRSSSLDLWYYRLLRIAFFLKDSKLNFLHDLVPDILVNIYI